MSLVTVKLPRVPTPVIVPYEPEVKSALTISDLESTPPVSE